MSPSLPALIIVTGAPATGKTTIARALAAGLRLPLISKDAIKEEIYDNLEDAEPSDSHRLGFVAIRLMVSWSTRLLQADVPHVVESNFQLPVSTDDVKGLIRLSRPVLVQCVAPDAEVIQRYIERSEKGERHPVHDDANHVDELRMALERGDYDLRGLGVPSVTVDSSRQDTDSVQDLIIRIQAILAGKEA